jgi:hypothetical protein
MTGPIIFADDIARSQLVETGEAVTFRARDRTTGETWWRESRTGPKRGDCTVRKIEEVVFAETRDPLFEHVERSGFASVDNWMAAIATLDDGVPDAGWLFEVTLGGDST